MLREETYYVFYDLSKCNRIIKEINKRNNIKGKMTWCEPQENQIEESWIIPYQENEIKNCLDLLEDYEEIDKLEAERRGWYFGLHKGSFAREREKLEDIHFIFDTLLQSINSPNFPTTRALTLSFLSACYSLKESLYKKIKKPNLNNSLGYWSNCKKKEQETKNELLQGFHQFMNTEKHGGFLGGQKSEIKITPHLLSSGGAINKDIPDYFRPYNLTMSSEGQLINAFLNTPYERRFPIGYIYNSKYEIKVDNAPKKHLDKSIENATFLEMMTLIMNYYMQLVFDAEVELGEKSNNIPPIYFNETQFYKY